MSTEPVGCMDCNADVTLASDPEYPNLIYMTISHDDSCPTYKRIQP